MKWTAPALVYLTVALGIFYFHDGWATLLAFHLVIVLSLLIARPNIPISIVVKNNNRIWIVLSVLLCGSSGVTLYFLWDYFGFAADFSAQLQLLGLNSQTWPPFIAYFGLVNPFIEEYFWRGYLGNPAKGFHLSDFLYSGFHALLLIGKLPIGSILYGLTVLILAGWFWRQIMREAQGLLAPVLGHMAADFAILLAIYLHV